MGLTSFYWIWHPFTRFYLFLLDLAYFYWIGPPFTGFDLLLLPDLTSSCWIWPPPFTGFDLHLLDLTPFYWIWPPFTGFDLLIRMNSAFDLFNLFDRACLIWQHWCQTTAVEWSNEVEQSNLTSRLNLEVQSGGQIEKNLSIYQLSISPVYGCLIHLFRSNPFMEVKSGGRIENKNSFCLSSIYLSNIRRSNLEVELKKSYFWG